jgi:hypothetical protein
MCGSEGGGIGVSGGASTRKVAEVFLSLASLMKDCYCCVKNHYVYLAVSIHFGPSKHK